MKTWFSSKIGGFRLKIQSIFTETSFWCCIRLRFPLLATPLPITRFFFFARKKRVQYFFYQIFRYTTVESFSSLPYEAYDCVSDETQAYVEVLQSWTFAPKRCVATQSWNQIATMLGSAIWAPRDEARSMVFCGFWQQISSGISGAGKRKRFDSETIYPAPADICCAVCV